MSRPTKFDRVVNREICQVTTKGTRIFTVVDGESKDATSKFLLALSEKENNDGAPVYGVSFVDTSIGTFYIGQFQDDRHSSRLRTLIATYPPAQVIIFFQIILLIHMCLSGLMYKSFYRFFSKETICQNKLKSYSTRLFWVH